MSTEDLDALCHRVASQLERHRERLRTAVGLLPKAQSTRPVRDAYPDSGVVLINDVIDALGVQAEFLKVAAPRHLQHAPDRIVAWRFNRRTHEGEWTIQPFAWVDGCPSAEDLDDATKNPDSVRIEYAYAGPPQPAAAEAFTGLLDELIAIERKLMGCGQDAPAAVAAREAVLACHLKVALDASAEISRVRMRVIAGLADAITAMDSSTEGARA